MYGAVLVLSWAWCGRMLADPVTAGRVHLSAAPQYAAALPAAVAQPVEENLRQGTVGLLRTVRWWYRHITATMQRAIRKWWDWLLRAALFVLVAVLASVLDRGLWLRWRMEGWRALQSYVSSAAAVYMLTAFDRRADRLGRSLLLAALLYGVVPWDLIPDYRLVGGIVDDVVLVAGASQWFMRRCPAAVIERHARSVEAWRERTRRIQADRRPRRGLASRGR